MTRSIRAGFTLLTVLLVVVLIGAIVAGVLSALRSQSISAIRGREESAARAIAETCADRMFAYSTSYIKEIAGGEAQPPADFDRLLDPNGVTGDDDDFLPPGSVSAIAVVPPGSTSSAHRFRVMRLDGGACLVRFDDNSDDWHPGLGDRSTSNNTLLEGPTVGDEVLNRDRDRSIWVSVVGVFPAFDTTSDAEVWTRAHARVSVRRFLETAGGPAVWAGDDVTLSQGGTAVCGLGGIVSESISRGSTDQCACGHQKHDTIANAIDNECNYTSGAGDACDDRTRACEPNLREEAPQPAPAGDELPTAVSFNQLPTPLVPASTCSVWLRDRDAPEPMPKAATETRYHYMDLPAGRPAAAEAFVWLPDSLRAGLVGNLIGALGAGSACNTLLGATLAACGAPALGPGAPTEACPDSPPQPTPPPCRYVADNNGSLTLQECRGNESRCWLPIARLDGKSGFQTATGVTDQLTDALLGNLPVLGLNIPVSATLNEVLIGDMIGVGEQTVVASGPAGIDREFLSLQDHPLSLSALLNGVTSSLAAANPLLALVINGIVGPILTAVLALPVVDAIDSLVGTILTPVAKTLLSGQMHWTSLCGGGCEDCTDAKLINVNGTSLTFGPDFIDQRKLPRGMTLIVENGPDPLKIPVAMGAGPIPSVGPLQLAIRAQGDVDWTGKSAACCPTCRCPGAAGVAAVVTGGVVTRPAIPAVLNALPKRFDGTEPPPPPPPGTACDSQAAAVFLPDEGGSRGVRSLLHSDGACRINGASTLIGRISCADVTLTNASSGSSDRKLGGCFIGGIDARPCPAGSACPLATPPSVFNTCKVGSPINNCDDIGVCIEGAIGIVGNVRSTTDVCIRSNTTIYGQVIAADDVAVTRGLVINHDNAGSIGAVTQAQAWLESYP